RLTAAVNYIMMTGADDARKTTLIRAKLGEVSTNIDLLMVQTFKRGFPDLAGCVQQYARLMKAAAASEKNFVTTSMEQFAHGMAPGKPSLDQWWAAMQQQLTGFGCPGCTLQAIESKSSASGQKVAQGCTTENMPSVLLAAAAADDGSQADVA